MTYLDDGVEGPGVTLGVAKAGSFGSHEGNLVRLNRFRPSGDERLYFGVKFIPDTCNLCFNRSVYASTEIGRTSGSKDVRLTGD